MSIRLSPKYGLNPTMPVCFWCGQEKGEIALLGRLGNARRGEDFQAPNRVVLDFEPCDACKALMRKGVTLMEATSKPNRVCNHPAQNGVYPTGRYAVVKPEAVGRVFGDFSTQSGDKAYVDAMVYSSLFD